MLDLDKEYGLVLSGGGAKGAFQIGAWKAFKELGIKFKGVVGTSVGALNGALVVQDDFEKAIDLWQNISYKTVLDIDDKEFEKLIKLNYKELHFDSIIERIKGIAKQKGFDTTALKNLIDTYLDEARIRESELEFGLVTYSISDMKPMEVFVNDVNEGELLGFLLASSYLPVFKQEKINGKYFLDGGFHSATPMELLIDKGYKDIIVVKLGGPGIERKVSIDGINVITIDSSESLGMIMEFSKEKANYNIELGYYNTMRVLRELRGDYYYIECRKREAYFLGRLLKTDKTTMKKFVRGSINIDSPPRRYFLEQGLPNLAKKMKLDVDWTYDKMVLTILETVAKQLELERFKVYEYTEFRDEIKSRIDEYKEKISYDKKSNDIYCIFADIIKVL